MKKNFIGLSILLALSLFLSSCVSAQDSLSVTQLNQYLISNSIELTCTMDNLAESDGYIKLISAQPDFTELINDIGADDYTSPNEAVLVKVSDAAIDSIIKHTAGELNLTNDAYEMVVTRMCAAVPSRINALQGVNTIAATSMLSASKAFPSHKDFADNTYVVLIYDNYNSVTFFKKYEGEITYASSSFLFLSDDMKEAALEGTVIDFLSEIIDISGIEVEYISGDEITGYR